VTGSDRCRGKGLVYGDIAAELRRRIETGEVPPGAPIGTLRFLAEEDFHVAKGTVERAVNQLREEHWVYSRTGSGIFALGPEARQLAGDTVEADLGRQLAEIRAMILELREDLIRRDGAADERLTDLEGHVTDLYSLGAYTLPEGTGDDAATRRAGGTR
jgi:DNA-binding GntR family transcriptional regulator